MRAYSSYPLYNAMFFARFSSVVLFASLAALGVCAPVPMVQEAGTTTTLEYSQRLSWIEGFMDGISFSSAGQNAAIAAANDEKGVASAASKESAVFGFSAPGNALSFVIPAIASPSPST